jgi:toxin ParE1/3/4
MPKYALTNQAVEDLSGIWQYTFDTWSERQADKYYSLLIDSFEEIARRPEIGRAGMKSW